MRIEFNTQGETLEGLRTLLYIVERELASRNPQTDKDVAPQMPAAEESKYRGAVFDPDTGVVLTRPEAADFGVTIKNGALDARQAFGGAHPLSDEANVISRANNGNPLPPTPPSAAATAPAVSTPAPSAATGAANGLPTPPAPITPPAPASPGVAAERDSNGDPYDARIHSEARTKNNDGSWRFRRKLDEAVKASVLAEIRSAPVGSAVQFGNGAVPPPPPPPPVVVPPPPPPVTLPAPTVHVPPPPPPRMRDTSQPEVLPSVNPTAAGQAQSSGIAGTSAAGTVSGGITFRDLVIKLNVAIAAGKLSQEALQIACAEIGLDSPSALASPQFAHLAATLDAKLFPA